jgi:hypothetical protein
VRAHVAEADEANVRGRSGAQEACGVEAAHHDMRAVGAEQRTRDGRRKPTAKEKKDENRAFAQHAPYFSCSPAARC